MNTDLEKTIDSFIENAGKLGSDLGLNRVAAQLYALLFMSSKPLSLDDMVEKLEVSKGNVSVNIRELEKWGAAHKVWIKGSRKDFYTAEPDVFKVITNQLEAGLSKRMDEALEVIKNAEGTINAELKSFSKEDKEQAKAIRERLGKAKEMYWRLNSLTSTAFKIMS